VGPLWLGRTNLAGDGQADTEHHGGPDKAVCAYPAVHYSYWLRELALPELPFGAFGENFTIAGAAEPEVCIGDIFSLGDALLQLSQPRQPCWKVARRWRVRDLAARVQSTGFTGWYFRVQREGEVEAGLQLRLQDRPCPEWPVARANRVMHRDRHDLLAARTLAACSHLSTTWRTKLERRAKSLTSSFGARDDGGAYRPPPDGAA
jgi:MOSC domain-containing protein YiiM